MTTMRHGCSSDVSRVVILLSASIFVRYKMTHVALNKTDDELVLLSLQVSRQRHSSLFALYYLVCNGNVAEQGSLLR